MFKKMATVKNNYLLDIIMLSEQTPEEIVVISGDDPKSAIHGADARDGRLRHQGNNKNERKALSN